MAAVVGAQRSAPALARKGLTDNHAGGDRAVHIGSREHWKRRVTGVRAGRQWRAVECEQELSRGSVGAVVYNHGPSVTFSPQRGQGARGTTGAGAGGGG